MSNLLSVESEIFKAIFFESPTAQILLNNDFQIEAVNEAFTSIFDNEEAIHLSFDEIFSTIEHEGTSPPFKDGIYSASIPNFEKNLFQIIFTNFCHDGIEKHLASVFPIELTEPFTHSHPTHTYLAINNTGEIIFIKDPDDIFVQSKLQNKLTFKDLFHSKWNFKKIDPWHSYLRNGETTGTFKFKNRKRNIYQLNYNAVRFAKFGLHFFFFEDVTEFKRIQRGHELMSVTFETIDTPIVCMDDNFNISYINRAGLELWELNSLEEAVETNIEKYFTQNKRFKIIREQLNVHQKWNGRLNGISLKKQNFDVSLSIKEMPVSSSLKFKWLVTMRKVDQELKREQRLKKYRNRYKQFFKSTPDAVFIVNADGVIEKLNPSAEKMFGYKPSELSGQPVEVLVPDKYKKSHKSHRVSYLQNPARRPMGTKVNFEAKKSDGTCIPVDIMLGPLEEDNQLKTLVAIRDTSKFINAKKKIKESLEEKENLLKEMHHRVKNNLAVVSGLLELQLYQEQDERLIETLRNGINRIKSIAMVHEQLYQLEKFASLKFDTYLENLCKNLHHAQSNTHEIQIITDLDPIHLSIEYAIPCALILNEIITNSLKHAFPHNHGGEIKVELKKNPAENTITFRVSDNGKGIPEEFISGKKESLGITLIHILTQQIDGQLTISNQKGTVHSIIFCPM